MTGAGLSAEIDVPGRVRAALEARPGEVVALIGPNGAGKSSVVRALAGIVGVTGHARLDGVDLLALPVREREVGLVFQGQLLFPHLTALDNVAFGPRARGVPRLEADERAREWLDRLGVGDLAHRKPRELSGGQAQRVAIARALAPRPRLLLLDEPLTGLDVKVAMALRIELGRHLAGYDGVTLLVTHHAIDALTLADRVVVLEQGRVAQVGSPAEVSRHPRTEHVARLVGLNVVRQDDELVSFPPGAVTVSLEEPGAPPRLRWRGIVADASPHGDAVRLLVHASPDLVVDVAPAAATGLGLVPGREVWLAVDATSVRRYPAYAAKSPGGGAEPGAVGDTMRP